MNGPVNSPVDSSVIRRVLREPGGAIGAALVGLLVLSALVSLVWTPFDPTLVDPAAAWAPPLTGGHPLGADGSGRDLFSQLLAGARITAVAALAATVVAGVVGVGLAAAVAVGRRSGDVVSHLIDVLVAFPTLLLAMVLAAVYGGSVATAVVAIGIGTGVNVARVGRAEMSSALGTDYVLAARASGASTWRIVRTHVLPNVAPVLLVQLSLTLALAVLAEAALSYLGFGTPPPTPSWGRMLQDLQQYVTVHPWAVLWPGLAITAAVLGFSLVGDALRDVTDPRLQREVVV
ncbi:Dipeptide transport system permease protein DppC [Pseudonocardia sp. Ae717_Ps2]|uniref:ABC transporter permease n=1 Tax=unclassified Pseudonocardia TaxID=2619320 RepID=UPI000967B818|nr:Dipeptide transport system permease protein DppC [Pseudonocardia sp. Ae505_Ps2]OLM31262.1 Dipeptide transport system permease protein DppC [Pseudonocardia sp. Ae717_Ps2]